MNTYAALRCINIVKTSSLVKTFVISVVIIFTFYLFTASAYGQTPYNTHGIAIVFPAGFGPPMESTTAQGITTVSMPFATFDAFFGTEADSGTMTISFYPVPITFQQIIAPNICQIQNGGIVRINSVPAQKVNVDCNLPATEETSEQYLINNTILIEYSATNPFDYSAHYPEFISSLATFHLAVNGTG